MNLKPFGESGDCDCDWEQNAQDVVTRQTETGFPYKTPKLPGLIMNKARTDTQKESSVIKMIIILIIKINKLIVLPRWKER